MTTKIEWLAIRGTLVCVYTKDLRNNLPSLLHQYGVAWTDVFALDFVLVV